MDTGEKRLNELGYKQELKRELSLFTNAAVSFSIISILTGVSTLLSTGISYGGPATLVYGWLIVTFFSTIVGLSMAEICSSYPTSGGLYYWSAALAGPKWGPYAAWMTGWFNAVGLWAVTASVDFSLAQWICTTILLSTGTGVNGGYYPSKLATIGIYGALLVIHGIINTFPVNYVAWLEFGSIVWNIGGTFFLVIVLPMVAVTTKSAKFVFATYIPDTGTGIDSDPYLFLIGLLFAQYTISGFDASAHMCEETKGSDLSGAYAIVTAVVVSGFVGFFYIIALLFSIQGDPLLLTDPTNEAGGYSAAQIFWSVFDGRYGSGTGGVLCMQIVTGAIFFCGMSCLASCSRMTFAFSRDNAMPGSRWWKKASPSTGVPVNAVWLGVVVAFCMGLPYLGSTVAFTAMTSVSTVCLFIAYGTPILVKLTIGRGNWRPGPFNLGFVSDIFGVISVCYILIITVLFCLPTVYPITIDNLQYSPVAVGGVFILANAAWLLYARSWFKGPVRNVEEVVLEVGKFSDADDF